MQVFSVFLCVSLLHVSEDEPPAAPAFPSHFDNTTRYSISGSESLSGQNQYPSLPPKPYQSNLPGPPTAGAGDIASAVSQLSFGNNTSNGSSSSWSQNAQFDHSTSTRQNHNFSQPSHHGYIPQQTKSAGYDGSSSQRMAAQYGADTATLSAQLGQIINSNPAFGNSNDSYDDEPLVPSYPHYVKGSRQLENMIPSKSYEFTAIRGKQLQIAL